MASRTRRAGPSPERLFWAGSLAALAVAGMFAAERFSGQLASGLVTSGCDASSVRWGYEVELSPGTGSYSLAGARFDRVPPGCAGLHAVISYRDEHEVLHQSQVVLADGLVDQLDPDVWTVHSLTAASWGIVGGA